MINWQRTLLNRPTAVPSKLQLYSMCRNPVARKQVQNVMWAALDNICSTANEPVETSNLTRLQTSWQCSAHPSTNVR